MMLFVPHPQDPACVGFDSRQGSCMCVYVCVLIRSALNVAWPAGETGAVAKDGTATEDGRWADEDLPGCWEACPMPLIALE